MKWQRRIIGGIGSTALLGLFLMFYSSCGGEVPELVALEWRIEERPFESSSYPSLSIFASLHDSEAIEDIESVTLLNEEAKLSWRLTPSNWSKRQVGNDIWIGGANLVLPDYAPFPEGEYRLFVTNLAGQQSAKSFRVFKTNPIALPRLRMEKSRAILESVWPETILLAYDGAGVLLAAHQAKAGSNDLSALFGASIAAKAQAIAAYGYDPTTHHGAFTWRLKTN